MKSLGEVLQLSSRFLTDKKIDRPRRLVEELLSHLLQCKRMDLYMQFDRPMDDSELTVLRGWVQRASKNEPVEYIVGELEFCGNMILVDSRVLIPRVETELLIEKIGGSPRVIWDICTGSGCIGISLKKKFKEACVVLSDISPDALALAQENGRKNGVDVEFFLGDLLKPFEGKKADLIVCNPPYVSSQEFGQLDPSVRDFEPKLALVGGEDGLDFYRRLALDLPEHLNEGGQVFLEIGFTQGKGVQEIFNSPIWRERKVFQDLSGKDRFFFLEKQSHSQVFCQLSTV